MDKFCVDFMNTANQGSVTNESTRQHFITSLKECHANGYYLVSANTGWKLSNKKPETLTKQMADFNELIKALFIVQR